MSQLSFNLILTLLYLAVTQYVRTNYSCINRLCRVYITLCVNNKFLSRLVTNARCMAIINSEKFKNNSFHSTFTRYQFSVALWLRQILVPFLNFFVVSIKYDDFSSSLHSKWYKYLSLAISFQHLTRKKKLK